MYFACTGTLPVETSSSQPVSFPFGFHLRDNRLSLSSSGYSPGSHYPISNGCITHLVIHTQSALHRVRYPLSWIHSGYRLSQACRINDASRMWGNDEELREHFVQEFPTPPTSSAPSAKTVGHAPRATTTATPSGSTSTRHHHDPPSTRPMTRKFQEQTRT